MLITIKTLEHSDYVRLCQYVSSTSNVKTDDKTPLRRFSRVGSVEIGDGINLLYHDVTLEITSELRPNLREVFKDLSKIFG